jgi:hypothetical protein
MVVLVLWGQGWIGSGTGDRRHSPPVAVDQLPVRSVTVTCCGMVWCGMVWCGMVWYGVVWYGVQ